MSPPTPARRTSSTSSRSLRHEGAENLREGRGRRVLEKRLGRTRGERRDLRPVGDVLTFLRGLGGSVGILRRWHAGERRE
jgi:hypothetical protein